MFVQAPVRLHLKLYEYWSAKRGSRAMPSRGDLDPTDIPALLPYLLLVERIGGTFRYRLTGTATAQISGKDRTGQIVGASLAESSANGLRAIYDVVFRNGCPVFATGELQPRDSLAASLLILPLAPDGKPVNMAISMVIARFAASVGAKRSWLKGNPIMLWDAVELKSAADLRERCSLWESAARSRPVSTDNPKGGRRFSAS